MLTNGIFFVNLHIDLAHYMRRFIVRTCNAFNESPKRRRKIEKKKKKKQKKKKNKKNQSSYTPLNNVLL